MKAAVVTDEGKSSSQEKCHRVTGPNTLLPGKEVSMLLTLTLTLDLTVYIKQSKTKL